jgi:hypothetical protein
MTEADWSASADPKAMLEFLRADGRAGERKQRLFAVACCRRLGPLLRDARLRGAVEAAERAADGDRRGLARAYRLAVYGLRAAAEHRAGAAVCAASCAALGAVHAHAASAADVVSTWAARAGEGPDVQASLLRELYGNPLRPVHLDPAWLAWGLGTVAKMARVVSDERRFDELPILADALEEAGCQDADILTHCRQGGGHLPGCWVLDAVLGKR